MGNYLLLKLIMELLVLIYLIASFFRSINYYMRTPTFALLKIDKIETIHPGAIPYESFEKTLTAIESK